MVVAKRPSTVAAALQAAGIETFLVARGDNLATMCRDGLHITICGDSHHVDCSTSCVGGVVAGPAESESNPSRLRVVASPEEVGKMVDYLFLTVKTYSLQVMTHD